MAEILLVNPRKRRKGRKHAKRKTATRVSRKPRRAAAPAVRHKRRKARRARRRTARRSAVSVKVYRSNPSLRGITGQIMPTVKAGFTGAIGAVGLDVLSGVVMPRLPAALQTGVPRHLVRILGAVLVGTVGNMVMRGKGKALADGAATVALYGLVREQVAKFLPTLPMGEYLSPAETVGYDLNPALPMQTGVSGMGEYLSGLAGLTEYGDNDATTWGGTY
jgi:hypothetical protein